METREITTLPGAGALYAKAGLTAIPLPGFKKSGNEIPSLQLVLRDTKVDQQKLSAYNNVCGFSASDKLPATYPFIVGFPLHMLLMTDKSWPLPVVGSVHVDNTINQHRPIGVEEAMTVKVYSTPLKQVSKGRQFGLITDVYVADELVWDSTANIIVFGGGNGEKGTRSEAIVPGPVTASQQWDFPEDTGRRYGKIAGDLNPIHLYAATAKPLGFPRAIAHGMYAKARAVAALESYLPDAYTVFAQFRKPILLPGKVDFGLNRRDDGQIDYALMNQEKGTTFQSGAVLPLAK